MIHCSRKPKRNGAVLVCVLACLVIVTGLTLNMVKATLAARRESRHRMQISQTEWLLQAGVQRAAKRMMQSADYPGEIWDCSDAIDRFDNATVFIKVDADQPKTRTITVTSSLGGSEDDLSLPVATRTVRSHQFSISVPKSSKAE